MNPQHKKACPTVDVLDSALTLRSHDAGSVRTWVHLHPSHPNWQEVSIKESEWTVLPDFIIDSLSEMDCLMMQQMAQTGTSLLSSLPSSDSPFPPTYTYNTQHTQHEHADAFDGAQRQTIFVHTSHVYTGASRRLSTINVFQYCAVFFRQRVWPRAFRGCCAAGFQTLSKTRADCCG